MGCAREALGKADYAMFHAATVLCADGVMVSKHGTLIAELGRSCAKTGRVEARRRRELIDARDERQEADYNVFLKVAKAPASKLCGPGQTSTKNCMRLVQCVVPAMPLGGRSSHLRVTGVLNLTLAWTRP